MYIVNYVIENRKFSIEFLNEKQATMFKQTLTNAGIALANTEPALLHVSVSFSGRRQDRTYSYVAVNIDVQPGQAVIIPVVDYATGASYDKLAVAMAVKPATVQDIRLAAAACGRKKLSRIKEVVA